ncbi:MAG: hypothetical protein DIU69_10305 [Bacillota bacterium]|nr:MAG: hypothetical protein DIU69_10305 [Bacillota bacterium]
MSDGVITLEQIRERARGEVIEIPDWDGRGTIKVRARKIDITPIVLRAGIIPNSLKVKAQEVFEGEAPKRLKADEFDLEMEKLIPALDAIVKEALVEPKYEDIQAILPLTLMQKLAIFRYVTKEVQQLESFRGEQ